MARIPAGKHGGTIQVTKPDLTTSQSLTIGATATDFAATIRTQTDIIRIFSTVTANVSWIGDATTSSLVVGAGVPEYFHVPLEELTISMITATGGDGTAWVVELL